MECKICSSKSHFIFTKKILSKYEVSYFKCSSCGFIQTEDAYWLSEAYELPFTPLDVYLVSRPLEFSQLTENLILKYFDYKSKFLDYGGGVGVFTRMMRDRGLKFYRQDKYAQNLFTQYFDVYDLPEAERNFELVTSFEVLEHLENPLGELKQIFSFGQNLLFSTVLQPSQSVEELKNWSYLAELHGQHISFFTKRSMEILAENFKCYYYHDEKCPLLHLFTPIKITDFSFFMNEKGHISTFSRLKNKLLSLKKLIFSDTTEVKKLESLIQSDTQFIIQELQNKSLSTK
ncbi:hypothetical protein NIES2101_35025 [Calothrix sp. HK-06]|nr:hypothetical protein NIES2101_35025 [Calothrix sp. HK-06]